MLIKLKWWVLLILYFPLIIFFAVISAFLEFSGEAGYLTDKFSRKSSDLTMGFAKKITSPVRNSYKQMVSKQEGE